VLAGVTQAAKEKRIATSKQRMLAVRAWERKHDKVHDWNQYKSKAPGAGGSATGSGHHRVATPHRCPPFVRLD
jgi:hypothetical protein